MSDVRNLICVSDIHAGCCLGLCPPEGATLDDGGKYMPSAFQRKVWRWWLEAWEWVDLVTAGEPYGILFNGDAIDGVHHRSTTQISQNVQDQVNLAHAILSPLVERCGGRYIHVRGTEAHVGPSAADEERLAQRLGAVPDAGNHARWEAWIRLRGVLIHALHHIGTTGSSAYESTALHKEYTESEGRAARVGLEPPQVIVRSHRHRYIATQIATARGPGFGVVTPAWQGKTPFAWKIPGARLSLPEFGLVVIRVSDTKGAKVTETGDAPVRHLVWTRSFERPKEVVWQA